MLIKHLPSVERFIPMNADAQVTADGDIFQYLSTKGDEVYPLRQKKIKIGTNVVYDRDTRNKSWFILALKTD